MTRPPLPGQPAEPRRPAGEQAGPPPSFPPSARPPRETSGRPITVGRPAEPVRETPARETRPPSPVRGTRPPTPVREPHAAQPPSIAPTRTSGQPPQRAQGVRVPTRPAAPGRPGPVGPGGAGPAGPGGPVGPGRPGAGRALAPLAPRGPRRRRRVIAALAVLLALALVWPIGLLVWANGKIVHVQALDAAPDTTPATTYLLAGSDARGGADGIIEDGTVGARTDTIMVLTKPAQGPASLISLPRDTYVDIPGHGPAKLNAAYAFGGPTLLVSTVEQLTGMHVDHYVEIGLGGVSQLVTAVGGVEVCFDPAVDKVSFPLADPDSGLVWDAPGCKVVDGPTAVSYARMRKADLEGDIGRARRQQRVIHAVAQAAADPSLLWHPSRQVSLIDAGLGAVRVDERMGIVDLGRLALAFRSATGPQGVRGTPPIANPDYRPGGVGSTVLLDPATTPAFWNDVATGALTPGSQVGGLG